MRLHLLRDDVTPERTIGSLSCNGVFMAYTLEDPVRYGPKIAHETAIPAGTYRVTVTRSQRFGVLLPLLLDVPGFEGIRIHAGNTTADTSGCILVGLARTPNTLVSSRRALERVQGQIAKALAQGERVTLTITDAVPERTLVA